MQILYMINQKEKAIEFIEKVIINDISVMHKNGLYFLSFVIMSNAIETLGAFLDNKPLRARAQSQKRFNLAINKLFLVKYKKANNNNFLYDKLRNHLSHNILPSSYLILADKENESQKHLTIYENKLFIAADILYIDLVNAAKIIIKKINNNELKNIKF